MHLSSNHYVIIYYYVFWFYKPLSNFTCMATFMRKNMIRWFTTSNSMVFFKHFPPLWMSILCHRPRLNFLRKRPVFHKRQFITFISINNIWINSIIGVSFLVLLNFYKYSFYIFCVIVIFGKFYFLKFNYLIYEKLYFVE